MHPYLAYHLAEQHVQDLLRGAGTARLVARPPRRLPTLRLRAGLRRIAQVGRLGAAQAPADR